jgi:hypothetical protein
MITNWSPWGNRQKLQKKPLLLKLRRGRFKSQRNRLIPITSRNGKVEWKYLNIFPAPPLLKLPVSLRNLGRAPTVEVDEEEGEKTYDDQPPTKDRNTKLRGVSTVGNRRGDNIRAVGSQDHTKIPIGSIFKRNYEGKIIF